MLLVGTVALSAGCTQLSDGVAAPSTSIDKKASTAALWDPCTQISDQTLRSLDVDPSTRDSKVSGVDVEGWKTCSWHKTPDWDYTLGVWSTVYTVEDFKKKSDNVDFAAISIAGHSGFRFRRASDTRNEDCSLVFPVSQGSVQITIYSVGSRPTASPCDRAAAAANSLVSLFPQ
ncbi:DUF3558 domain-containing protein [Nocardia sp. NPDC004573]